MYEIREIDGWRDTDWWYWDCSYNIGEMKTKAKNKKKAFTNWLRNHYSVTFRKNRTRIDYDGDKYTIIDRKTKEPLFVAIPLY